MPDSKRQLHQRFAHIAHNIRRVYKQIEEKDLGNNLFILRTLLKSLSTVASAWALSTTSPSLFIALENGFADLKTDKGKKSVIGPELDSILDGTLDGLLGGVETGPRAEIQEMAEMHATLTNLRDHGEEGA